QRGPARDRRRPRGPEARAAAPAPPDRPASPNDDFWDRVNEELATDAQRGPDTPAGAAPAGPPPPAAGGDLWSRPADRRADEAVGARSSTGDSRPGPPRARAHWSARAPRRSRPPGSP